MGHPDFRVHGKVFATLGWPDKTWGMIKLMPDEQTIFLADHPGVFEPVPGTWGKRGSTKVKLERADAAILNRALAAAWQNGAHLSAMRRGRRR